MHPLLTFLLVLGSGWSSLCMAAFFLVLSSQPTTPHDEMAKDRALSGWVVLSFPGLLLAGAASITMWLT